ncbi:unnamed protein product [Didymodactylos carnosus]|uniref:Major facilitator superfamily (MFS) profile domain-containing protein n=1 Tax=Didymodactylos carnosus TaxID=1234261 RepID=A0A814QI03_9BILA|nr:unnamed protein product [Didymodactylos carnosus]CAF1120150.1 unnamed protein product [Didymodactylos carnosus]CAF3742440.1 unnamed protein product [Didymodactylos carnosus]CAF3883804.1 unnamed protein product [Didymodactylos carnosus]
MLVVLSRVFVHARQWTFFPACACPCPSVKALEEQEESVMDVDHINYQQDLQNAINDDKQHQEASKSQTVVEQNSGETILNGDTTITPSKDDMKNNDHGVLLSPKDKRQRTTTLVVMGLIALMTGIDYAIILPTAWGYINQYMVAHYSGLVMGAVLSVFAFSGAVSGIVLGYLNDIGYRLKRLILVAFLFKILGNILYFLGINVYVIVISRLITGIGMGVVPPLLAEVSRRSMTASPTRLLAKILACRQIGLFLGPCFTLVMTQMNFKIGSKVVTMYNAPGLIMSVLWFIMEIIVVFFYFDRPNTTSEINDGTAGSMLTAIHNKKTTVPSILRQCYNICKKPPILVLLTASFVAYFNQTALETTLTPFTTYQFGWHELQVSILFAIAGIEITLVYVALHFASKAFSERAILLFGFIILSIACLVGVVILPFSKPGSTKFLPIFLVFVFLDILALPLLVVTSTAVFMLLVKDENQGLGQGVQRFVISVATIVGPLYAGGLLQEVFTMLCTMLAIVVFTMFLIIITYKKFKPKDVSEESMALIQQS